MRTSIILLLLLSVLAGCDSVGSPGEGKVSAADSLWLETRLEVFEQYKNGKDTVRAYEVLRQLEPSLRQRSPEKLRSLYLSMSILYRNLQQADQHERWVSKVQPYLEPRKASWYLQICDSYMELGDYRRAICYADTAIRLFPPRSIVQIPHLVKGVSLSRLGKTDEALDWFKQSIHQVREFQREKKIGTMSHVQTQLFYEYAALLQRLGRSREALSVMDTLPIPRITAKILANTGSTTILPLQITRLLAECSQDAGDSRMAARYAWLTDSLQTHLDHKQHERLRDILQEQCRNEQLLDKLAAQEEKVAQARSRQHLLVGTIAVLTAIILSGGLWWRSRRRRLRRLFDLLATQHATWLRIHEPYLLSPPLGMLPPERAVYEEEVVPDEEAQPVTPENLRRLYDQALRVMRERQPFLDPTLDLITLARLVGTNRTDLSTALNRQTGMNFSRWLAEYRVNHLLSLAKISPEADLIELATKAGFTSRTSFFRQFRQVTGLTPNQYKSERKQAS